MLNKSDCMSILIKLEDKGVDINAQMKKLILVRHVLTEDNKLAKLSGHIDSKVSEEGKIQIEKITDFLSNEKIDKIYLYRLINKIEIDKDKNIYIYFNFSKQEAKLSFPTLYSRYIFNPSS